MNTASSEVIKTIDNDIIEGEVLNADEEYLSVKQGQGDILFIQWRIISLVSREREIIVVHCDGEKKNFTILASTKDSLSARDISVTTTDKIPAFYHKEELAQRPLYGNEAGQSVHVDIGNAVNNERTSQEGASQKSKPWSGYVDAGLTLQTGNKEALISSAKTGFLWERIRDNFYLNGLFLFGTENGEKNADEQQGIFKYERKHKERLYSFHQESLEHDEIEKLNLRSITSSGIGYRFIQRKYLKYKSELGPSFIYEMFRGGVTQTNPGLRIGNYLDWQVYDSTRFYFKVDFLPMTDSLIKWRLESDVGLRHNLNKYLSLNIDWIDQYDSNPGAEDVSNNDATILSTIGYNF